MKKNEWWADFADQLSMTVLLLIIQGIYLHSNDNYFSTFLKQVVGLDAFNIIKSVAHLFIQRCVYTFFLFNQIYTDCLMMLLLNA